MNINKPTQFNPGEGRTSKDFNPTWSNMMQQLPYDIFDILELPSNVANKTGAIPDDFHKRAVGNAHDAIDDLIGTQGNRNILQELLFNPVDDHPIYSPAMKGIEAFKKPFIADFLRNILNIPTPQQHSIGSEYYDDLNTNTDKQQELLNQQRYYNK